VAADAASRLWREFAVGRIGMLVRRLWNRFRARYARDCILGLAVLEGTFLVVKITHLSPPGMARTRSTVYLDGVARIQSAIR
jgi:hypothetical protein